MKVELTKEELEVLECFAAGWGHDGNYGLYGGLSYQFAYDLCKKLGIEVPHKLKYFCSDQYEEDMKELLGESLEPKEFQRARPSVVEHHETRVIAEEPYFGFCPVKHVCCEYSKDGGCSSKEGKGDCWR